MSHSSWVPASTLPFPPWLPHTHKYRHPRGFHSPIGPAVPLTGFVLWPPFPVHAAGGAREQLSRGLPGSAQSLTWVLTLSLPLRTHTLLSCRQTSHTASVPARLAPSVGWGEGICGSQSLPRALPSSPRAWHSSAAESHPLTVGLLLQGVDFGGQG